MPTNKLGNNLHIQATLSYTIAQFLNYIFQNLMKWESAAIHSSTDNFDSLT